MGFEESTADVTAATSTGQDTQDPGSRRIPVSLRQALVLFLFLLSGTSGLIYEVVWMRQLTFIFGATLPAISTVLGAFMGGLALGSWGGGRVADRVARPLRLYGILESGIAVSALGLLALSGFLAPFYGLLHRMALGSEPLFNTFLFVVNFLMLLVPTTLMGATLPVLSRLSGRLAGGTGTWTGTLYAMNTLGAVGGCLWAGFHGIAVFGITFTTATAAFLNMAVGVAAWMLPEPGEFPLTAETAEPPPSPEETFSYAPRIVAGLFAAYALSGMMALGYQVLWTRALVFTFSHSSNTTYAFSAMLAVFLLGISLGSAVMSPVSRRVKDPLMVLARVQILIGLSTALSAYLIARVLPFLDPVSNLDPETLDISWLGNVLNVFVKSSVAMLPATLLMGAAFPLVVRCAVPRSGTPGRQVGRVYAWNTVGALVGAVLTGFVVVPILGLTKSMIAYALVNVGIAVWLTWMNPSNGRRKGRSMAIAGGTAAAVLVIAPGSAVLHQVKDLHSPDRSRVLFYEEGPIDTASVIQDPFGRRWLYIDKRAVGGTHPVMLTDQKTLAHLPMLVTRNPRRALAFGFGTGGTAWSFLRYPELERLDIVELSPTVVKTAPYFLESNRGLMEEPRDPRMNIIVQDARHHLRLHDVQYDIIEIDCTDLSYKANANLYTREFFDAARRRLNPDGVAVAWFPIVQLSEDSLKSVLRTFNEVFPYMYVWYFNNYSTHYILLLGKETPLEIDYGRFLRRLATAGVAEDLESIHLANPSKILSSFVTDQDALRGFLDGAVLNTEDHPYLEFYVPRSKHSTEYRQKSQNLNVLMGFRRSVLGYLNKVPAEETGTVAENLARYEKALPFIIIAHGYWDRGETERAYEGYAAAARITPEDTSLFQQMLVR